ncbi:pyrroline-5-carboxylate reductase [Sulfobacillus thermosulfidooxidans DSM 9293]|uniref:Pyrroline-5-carboxylate reductase n=2 Tax=Sulfobacillus thermosulfidooxidans TaxID=28034 RepID=A0A1W1W724_SULTA|nr:pyrroline-5-carboxylate reductase [Sulfobacillus thermosulfidooxidans]PSR27167.1 MAG: pyrroline-5-carboxylate reductase [Sulfobacillus thermosulfidooxidans]SMC01860.1 pyrroline-5-carboxylate reductase [Sulfobacillus thermosulfidooxidans DSM 9293]
MSKKIVVVGPGNIAHAIVSRWLRVAHAHIYVLARSKTYLTKGWSAEEQKVVTFDPQVIIDADLVVFAVKPKDMIATIAQLKPLISKTTTVLSVAAGIAIAQIRQLLPEQGIVRTMPNICSEIGTSVTGISFDQVSEDRKEWILSLLNLLGHVVEMPEHLLNPMTALYGSGPAYVYVFLQSIIHAAEDLGIPADQARELAAYMVQGASQLALVDSDKSLQQLVEQVVSPGGTTEAMLKVLDQSGWQDIMHQALKAAGERATQLGGIPTRA